MKNFVKATKAWNHARRTIDAKRVSPGWYQNGLVWAEYATGRTSEEEPRATLIIALCEKKRNDRLKRPKSAGEMPQVERNHPLDVVSQGLLKEEYHSAWRPKE
jgi:hypothetical protein